MFEICPKKPLLESSTPPIAPTAHAAAKNIPIPIAGLAEFFGVTCDYLLGVTNRNLKNMDDVIDELEEIKRRIENLERFLKNG